MSTPRLRPSWLGVAASLLLLHAASAAAQDWPQRPVRIIVPFAAGGNTDSIARIGGDWLRQQLGQAVVIENRTGASGAIAAEAVARAAPDGYTLFMAALPQLAVLPHMTRVSYDPVTDFAPITIIGSNAFGLAVHADLPVASLADLVAYAKARPGAISYASAGQGSSSHLTTALFLTRAGISMVHVPYRGSALALPDVLSGRVPIFFGNLAEVMPHQGKLRLLATSGERRAAQLPDVPTVAESGYPGFRTWTWNGFAAPAATPAAIVQRIADAMAPACRDAGFVERLNRIAVDAVCSTPAAFATVLREDFATMGEAVRVSGATIE